MSNHPNRSRRSPGAARNPKPEDIRAVREAASLTQTEAAQLIHSTLRTWQDWEAGIARMHPAFWEDFRAKLYAQLNLDSLPPELLEILNLKGVEK